MKKTNKILQTLFYSTLAVSLIMVVLFEFDILESGIIAAYGETEFATATTMELITICSIPVVLRTFKFGFIKRSVRLGGETALRLWSVIRLSILCVLMTVNTLLYYVFMNVAFGYMSIITFLCMFLIFPSAERLKKEMEDCKE